MEKKDPIRLTEEEEKVVNRIKKALTLLELQERESEESKEIKPEKNKKKTCLIS